MDAAYLQTRITATTATIIAFQAAIDAFAANGALLSYTIDTGQSRQTVTRSDINSLNKQIDVLESRLAAYNSRLNGSTVVGRPAW